MTASDHPTGAVAYWNKDSGAVWVEFTNGNLPERLADGVGAELAAYDALAGSGFSRQKNWTIVPGNPRRRCVEVFRAQES